MDGFLPLLSLASLFLLLLLTAGALFVGLIRHEAQNKGLSAVGFLMARERGGRRLEGGARIQELGDVALASSGQLPEEAS